MKHARDIGNLFLLRDTRLFGGNVTICNQMGVFERDGLTEKRYGFGD